MGPVITAVFLHSLVLVFWGLKKDPNFYLFYLVLTTPFHFFLLTVSNTLSLQSEISFLPCFIHFSRACTLYCYPITRNFAWTDSKYHLPRVCSACIRILAKSHGNSIFNEQKSIRGRRRLFWQSKKTDALLQELMLDAYVILLSK